MKHQFSTINVLEDLYGADKHDHEIDLSKLSKMFGINQGTIAEALGLESNRISKNPFAPDNKPLKKWLVVFNLIIELIRESEPGLEKQQVQTKMKRWLNMPQVQLDNQTPLTYMLKGKTRKVINLLEQLVG